MLLARDYIARCAACYPEKVAYIDGERRRTWRQMHQRSDQLAAALQQLGVGVGDPVALLAHDHLELIEHWFACMKIGAPRVGINWRYAPREMLHLIRDSGARVLIVQAELVDLLGTELDTLRNAGLALVGVGRGHDLPVDYETLIEHQKQAPRLPPLAPHDRIAISYTTGTTGLPKGAIWTQQMVCESMLYSVIAAGLRHDDVWLLPVPLPGATVMFANYSLVNGMTTVLPGGPMAPDRLLDTVAEHRVSALLTIPTILQRVLETYRAGHYDASSLRFIGYGSSPAMPSLIRGAYDAFGCDFLQGYASTETVAGWVTCLRQADHERAMAGEGGLLRSVGRPQIQVEMSIRDDAGEPLPPGEVGELWIRAGHCIKEYLNRPEDNADAFSGDWLRSNDLARFDDEGFLYLTDRRKFMVISGGYNVYPVVVEAVLAEHPAVREVAVFGAPHPEWGEAVAGAVSLNEGAAVTEQELIEFCRGKVGRWEVPKFLTLEADLPKGATGKIDKQRLRQRYRDDPSQLPWSVEDR